MIKKVIFCVDLNEPSNSLNNKDDIEKRFVHGRSLDDLLKQYAAADLETGSSDGDFSDTAAVVSSETENESGNDEAADVDKRFVHGRGLIFDDNEAADEDFSE